MTEDTDLTRFIVDALEDLKALDIRILDVRGQTSVTDFLVIASGTSSRHVKSLADHVAQEMKAKHGVGAPRAGVYPFTDGSSTGQLDTTSKTLSEAYELIVKQRLQTLQTDCRGLGIPVIACITVDPIGKVLRPLFGGSR